MVQCDCGTIKTIYSSSLYPPNEIKSCGCYKRENLEVIKENFKTQGTKFRPHY